MLESGLIRFVAGPDGVVVPDLARRLPGRGMWVAANRASVDMAAKKGGFSRSAKAKLTAPEGLSDLVESLLRKRLLDHLGLARRSGELTYGFDKVEAAISAGKVRWLIEARDSADDGRRKMRQAVHRTGLAGKRTPELIGLFGSDELNLALGLGNVIHLAFLAGRGAESWAEDVQRLAGFSPLLPESWREEK
jgi:predicted RNA-binding protein YlxR (DUF448 family)